MRAAGGLVTWRLPDPDGRGAHASYYPLTGPDGKVTGVGAVVTDTTGRKAAEHALTDSEARLRLALDAARMGTFDWDLRTGALRWNPNHARIFGVELDAFSGTYPGFTERIHLDDVEAVEAERARLLAAERETRAALDRMLSLTPTFHAEDLGAADLAETICRAAARTFACPWASMWELEGEQARLVAAAPVRAGGATSVAVAAVAGPPCAPPGAGSR